ncbi:MAG: hypothetical protein GKR88_05795 [Flavobacteriaceae bacterium]|nr:MAG: hypothetical protein GKR88_05795 [Flavobacteriaceae bacterium]
MLDKLCYQYKYDHRNRLIEKKIPGKGWEHIVYDKLNRPVLTQDAGLKARNKWLFSKYDVLGRVIYTGFYSETSSSSRAAMQTVFDNKSMEQNYEVKQNNEGALGIYYSNSDFPNTHIEVLTVNYYDNYTFNRAGAPTSATSYGVSTTDRLTGLATGSLIKVLDTNHWITTVSYYDDKARPVYVYSKNDYLQTTDIVETKLDFTGNVLSTRATHTKAGNTPIVVEDVFTYDHAERLLTQKQTVNGTAKELVVKNHYDDLGQLIQKKVGDREAAPLQEVDYTYNIRGWLKKINDPSAGLADDLFSMELKYNDTGSYLYNGNISQILWKTASDNAKRQYSYYYDDLNRITGAYYYAWNETSRFNIGSISYDKNGNIQRLFRRGAVVNNPVISNAGHYGTMDYLSYTYDGNQLTKVTDNGNKNYGFKDGINTDEDYAYDTNGNMIQDKNKGITAISYNHLNLPTQVYFSTGKFIDYLYDAMGTKMEKKVRNLNSLITTQYAGNYVYENDVLQFFSTPEGYATPNHSGGFDYIYQAKDHLGNVRLSYTKNTNNSQQTVFTDGFESMANWDSSNGLSRALTTLDSSKKKSGSYSGRIDPIAATSDYYVYNDSWTAVNNPEDTYYYGIGVGICRGCNKQQCGDFSDHQEIRRDRLAQRTSYIG